MGYTLLVFSTGTYIGIQMFLFYFIIYIISGLCVWYTFILIRLRNKHLKNKYSKELSDLVLLKKSNSGIAFTFALTLFSIAGIPPLIGFLAKINIFLSVIGISFYYVALISIICSVVSTFYYIRIIKILYFESLLVGKLYYPINNIKTIILSFLVFLIVYLFLNPNFLYITSLKCTVYFL
jgi:NADH-quinone oxidoreductase subunit N